MAGKWIQHMRRTVISLHPCHKFHSYAYLEFVFVPEKQKQGKVSILLLFYSARIDKFTHFLGTRQKRFSGCSKVKKSRNWTNHWRTNSEIVNLGSAVVSFCLRRHAYYPAIIAARSNFLILQGLLFGQYIHSFLFYSYTQFC